MIDCHTCALVENRKNPDVPMWDSIFHAEHFDVAHAYSTSLPGWIVIVSKRHIAAIDEMTEVESVELGKLIRLVSVTLKYAVSCTKTYVMQFAEQPGHAHVHFHVVPRMDDIPEENKGPKVFSYLNVDPEVAVSEAARNDVAKRMREAAVALEA